LETGISILIKYKAGLKILLLFMMLDSDMLMEVTGQNIIVSPGTTISGTAGTLLLKGSVVNNGTFTNLNDTVVFNGSVQSVGGSVPVTFENLVIAAGSTVTATTAGQTISEMLISNGTLNSNGMFTILSDASGTGLINGSGTGQVNGNITLQRYLSTGFGYKYFSSPFQAATVAEFSDDINLASSSTAFYKYDESRTSTGWVNFKVTTNTLVPFSGYAVNLGPATAANTIDIKGTVNNGPLAVTLYNHNYTYTKGFNLVGNPYPSPIDWDVDEGWTRTNIDNAIYYFRGSPSNQWGGNYSSYINGISSDDTSNNIIPSMQGFFVHVTNGVYPVEGELSMDNRVRITDRVQTFLKSGDGKGVTSLLRLTAGYSDNPLSFDPTVIYFYAGSTYSFDGKYDALKIYNTDPAVTNFYSVGADGTMLSISAIPPDDSIPEISLGIKTARDGTVNFMIKDVCGEFLNRTINFIDKTLGQTIALSTNNYYTVFLKAGEYQGRFFLNFNDISTSLNDVATEEGTINIYSVRNIIKIDINDLNAGKGEIFIMNLSGQVLYQKEYYYQGHYEILTSVNDGIYIARYISGDRIVSKKLIIRR
jgi:hypothetical protein